MALIKLGAMVTQISGKVGGQQFGQNAGGHYIKNNGTPRKSITLKQNRQMSVMATTAQKWRTLTPLQRQSFISATSEYPYLNRVGETKFYSGYNIFAMLLNNKIIDDVDTVSLPIPLPKITFPPTSVLISVEAAHEIEIRINPLDPSMFYRLYSSRPTSRGVSNGYQNQFLVMQKKGSDLPTIYNIHNDLVRAFGQVPANSRMFFSLHIIHPFSGQFLKNAATFNTYVG